MSQQLQLQGFQQHPQLQIFPGLFAIILLERFKVYTQSKNNNAEGGEYFEVMLQIVCNADQKVIDCHLEMVKEYNFDNSPIGVLLNNENNGQILSKQCYLIGKNCFPLRSYLITPILKPRMSSEITFNRHMNTILNFGQNILNTILTRFNILRDNSLYEINDFHSTRQIMQTICVLHNLSIAIEDDYVDRVTIAPKSKRNETVPVCSDKKESNVLEFTSKIMLLPQYTNAAHQRRQELILRLSKILAS